MGLKAQQSAKTAMGKPTWIDTIGAVVALLVIGVYVFTVVAPYFVGMDTNENVLQLIDRNKGTVDTITVMVVSFFFGATYGRTKDQDTIHNLTKE